LKVTIDINAESQNLYFDGYSIKVPKGHVVQVKISFLIEPAYFDGEKPMFHSFMRKGFDFYYDSGKKFRKTPPVELFFETAKTSSVSELDLWEGLEISHLGDTVYARQNIKK